MLVLVSCEETYFNVMTLEQRVLHSHIQVFFFQVFFNRELALTVESFTLFQFDTVSHGGKGKN